MQGMGTWIFATSGCTGVEGAGWVVRRLQSAVAQGAAPPAGAPRSAGMEVWAAPHSDKQGG